MGDQEEIAECIATQNFLVSTLVDGIMYVYSLKGDVVREFGPKVWDMVNLFGDIVFSADVAGNVFCSDAATNLVYDYLQRSDVTFRAVFKSDPNTIVMGSASEKVLIITHNSEKQLKVERILPNLQSEGLMFAFSDRFVTVNKTVLHIWNSTSNSNAYMIATSSG